MAYLLFEETDTGHGIPPEIRDRIFEPFFTTKELGKGTRGACLRPCPLLKSHGGFITVDSEPEKGSSFQVYWPATSPADLDKGAEGQPLESRNRFIPGACLVE